ncbi:LPS export ABC transporter periplasmic protein LptC [Gammaproteobacteria bacterium]|nr:LPS export ABC transporter periplasmic protein LptC [Gammaproteobacteria bacterium]
MKQYLDRAILVAVLGVMAALGIWMQISLLEPVTTETVSGPDREPDYYIQNFTATGRDEVGVIYVLKAERLVHFPDDNTSLLDKPKLVQYENGQPSRRTTSESGWMSGDGNEILLTGDVEVEQFRSNDDPGNITRTQRLLVHLDRDS